MITKLFGSTNAAFGLEWVNTATSLDDTYRELASRLGSNASSFQRYSTVPEPEDVTLGVGLSKSALPRGTISAAQVLAKTNANGIFLLPIKIRIETKVWYCVIRNHTVVSKTDVVLDDNWANHVSALCRTLSLPVFAPKILIEKHRNDTDKPFFKTARGLDIAGQLRDAKAPALRKASSAPLALIGLVVAALVVVGALFYFASNKPVEQAGPSPEEIRRQRIQAFVTGASNDIEPYPASAQWAVDAMSLAQAQFPPFLAGWALSEVLCDPLHCEGLYKRSDVGGYSITPLIERFGISNVSMTDTSRAAKASFPLEVEMVNVTEAWLRSVKPEQVLLADWLGRIPDTMDEVYVSGQASKARLDMKYQATDLGFPQIVVEKVRFGSRHFLDIVTLYSLLQIGEQDRFRPTRLHWVPGTDGKRPSWSINWSRVHG